VTEVAADQEWMKTWPELTEYVAVRTRVFDDFFTSAVDAGIRQVVLLAAGLDTRAFRLGWPAELACYEVDQPAVLGFKLRTLRRKNATATCRHHPVSADLRDDWAGALTTAGFVATRPTAWLAEGLLPYLPPEATDALLTGVTRLSAPGSRVAVEHIVDVARSVRDSVIATTERTTGVDVAAMIHTSEPRVTPDRHLSDLGWRTRVVPAAEAATTHGRDPDRAPLLGHAVYIFGDLP
jgi:methyltransferase (TIGR00027 family)